MKATSQKNDNAEENISKMRVVIDQNCRLTDEILNRHSKFNQFTESQKIFWQLVQRSNILLGQMNEFLAKMDSYPFIALPLCITTRVALLDSITSFYIHFSMTGRNNLDDVLKKMQHPLARSFNKVYQKCRENGENIDPRLIDKVKVMFPGHFENEIDNLKLKELDQINTVDMVNKIQKADKPNKHSHFIGYLNYMILSNSEHFNPKSQQLIEPEHYQLLQILLPSLEYVLLGQFVSLQKSGLTERELMEAKSILKDISILNSN